MEFGCCYFCKWELTELQCLTVCSRLLRGSTWTQIGAGTKAPWFPSFTWFPSSWKVVSLCVFCVFFLCKWMTPDRGRKKNCEKRVPCLWHRKTVVLCVVWTLVPEVKISWALQSHDQTVERSLTVVLTSSIMWFRPHWSNCQGLRPLKSLLLACNNLWGRFTVSVKSILHFLFRVTLQSKLGQSGVNALFD